MKPILHYLLTKQNLIQNSKKKKEATRLNKVNKMKSILKSYFMSLISSSATGGRSVWEAHGRRSIKMGERG